MGQEVEGTNEAITSNRSKRLFFVSTNVAVVTCKRKRRKRNLADDAQLSDNSGLDISPERQHNSDMEDDMEEKIDNSELSPGLSQTDARDAKVLLYWLTTTSVIKTTSYTRTQTLASVACTPSSWSLSEC